MARKKSSTTETTATEAENATTRETSDAAEHGTSGDDAPESMADAIAATAAPARAPRQRRTDAEKVDLFLASKRGALAKAEEKHRRATEALEIARVDLERQRAEVTRWESALQVAAPAPSSTPIHQSTRDVASVADQQRSDSELDDAIAGELKKSRGEYTQPFGY